MIISFQFSIFNLEIEHKIIKELGEFTIFCMNAIHDNLTIEEISDIIKIKNKNIEKQLSFATSRGYLDNNFISSTYLAIFSTTILLKVYQCLNKVSV